MIPLLLLLGTTDAQAMTALDAERAFAADAKTLGQWTAFRKWSTDDAVMFVPQPTNAHEFLKDRKDPPKAIDWWPVVSYVSCDANFAVNTGGWKRPDGSVGSFTTLWIRKNGSGWRWLVDKGEDLKSAPPHPRKPETIRASCQGRPSIDVGAYWNCDYYYSDDRSLFAGWAPDGRSPFVSRWNGDHYQLSPWTPRGYRRATKPARYCL